MYYAKRTSRVAKLSICYRQPQTPDRRYNMSIFKNGNLRHTMAVITVSVVVLVAAVVISPRQGVCDQTNSGSVQAATISDTDPDPYRPSVEPTAPSEYRPTIFIQQEEQPEEKQVTYASSVNKALKYMKITPYHINMWADKRHGTDLKKLSLLPDDQQRRVACIACYIHKCNKRLPAETVWREACAIYFGSRQYNLSPELVAAVARIESHFNPGSVSRHGACGAMQVMYRVHYARLAKLGIAMKREDMFDPERGIYAGIVVLKGYVNAYGSVHKGLMRYLGGHSNSYYMGVQNHVTKMRRTGESLGL